MRGSDQKLSLKFVQEVEKREVLYNFNLPGYSRKDVVEKAWQEVSDEVNLPVSECREKWRNVRTVFIRKMKPGPKGCQRRRKAYYLADAMKFCLPYIKVLAPPSFRNTSIGELTMKSETYVEDDESMSLEYITEFTQEEQEEEEEKNEDEDEDEDEQESILPEYFESKKAKFETSKYNTISEEAGRSLKTEQKEALKMFLLSLMPEVENFSNSQIKQFKRKIFNIIDEISGVSYNGNG